MSGGGGDGAAAAACDAGVYAMKIQRWDWFTGGGEKRETEFLPPIFVRPSRPQIA
jgi:hypothetical protein